MLRITDTGISSAKENMDLDAKYLDQLSSDIDPILHFYDWKKDSISYGYFIDPKTLLDVSKLKKWNMDLAKRPTGGGIVFHIWDYAFSFLMPSSHPLFSPNTLENYRYVNQIVLQALHLFLKETGLALIYEDVRTEDVVEENFCMAHPTKYDVILHGKKIAGAAQRKTKKGYLHQGTISLGFPKKEILEDILLRDSIVSAMLKYSYAPLGEHWTKKDLQNARQLMKKLLAQSFENSLKELLIS